MSISFPTIKSCDEAVAQRFGGYSLWCFLLRVWFKKFANEILLFDSTKDSTIGRR